MTDPLITFTGLFAIGLVATAVYILIARMYLGRLKAARGRTTRIEPEPVETLPDVDPRPIKQGCDMPEVIAFRGRVAKHYQENGKGAE